MTRVAFWTGLPVTVAANIVSRSTSRTSSEVRPRSSYSVWARWDISLSRGPSTWPPRSPTVHIILRLFVDDHRQFLQLLGVVEEPEQRVDVRAAGRIAVGAGDRVHHDGAAALADVHLGGGADQDAFSGVHQEGPVGAALLLQQPPEQGERECGREVLQGGAEVAPDHEVGALAVADLLLDHPADDRGVRLVVDVERAAGERDRRLRQGGGEFGQRQGVLFGHREGLQRGPVVVRLEAALADLPVRDEREQVVHGAVGRDAGADRQVGEVPVAVDGAHQHLDGVRGEPGVRRCSRANAGASGAVRRASRSAVAVTERLPSGGLVRCGAGIRSRRAVCAYADGRPEGRPSCSSRNARSVGHPWGGPPPGVGVGRVHGSSVADRAGRVSPVTCLSELCLTPRAMVTNRSGHPVALVV